MNKAKRAAVIAGNWKMNKTPAEAKALIEEMKPLVAGADCDVVLCVPYVDIPAAIEYTRKAIILASDQPDADIAPLQKRLERLLLKARRKD